MKTTLIPFSSLLCLCIFSVTSQAQRKTDDPKHENHYSVNAVNTEKLSLEFFDSHSQKEFSLTKIKITNKTNDYLIFRTKEAVFKYDFGEFNPTGGGLFQGTNIRILPKDNKTVTLKVAGNNQNYHVTNLVFIPRGFYTVSANGKVQEVPDFKLPASSNDFTAGNFKCTVDKIDKETKETKVVFKCVYNGSDFAIADPNQMVVRLKSGQEFANDNREDKPFLLFPNDDFKIVAKFHVPGKTEDMQFNNMDLVWKSTFKESKMIPVELKPVDFTFDAGVTTAKNK